MSNDKWPEQYPDIIGPAPEIQNFLEILKPGQGEAKRNKVCVFCKTKISGQEMFRDELSWREYLITGVCQTCQDGVFSALEDDEEWDL